MAFLPLKCFDELMIFEEKLLNIPGFKCELVKDLKKIGGHNVREIIYKILTVTMTNEVALLFSWEGRKKKKAFPKRQLPGVIFETVRSLKKEATNTEMAEKVAKWLVKAKERAETVEKKKSFEVSKRKED